MERIEKKYTHLAPRRDSPSHSQVWTLGYHRNSSPKVKRMEPQCERDAGSPRTDNTPLARAPDDGAGGDSGRETTPAELALEPPLMGGGDGRRGNYYSTCAVPGRSFRDFWNYILWN